MSWESLNSTSHHRAWEHSETGTEIRVESFQNETWDAFRDERLLENFDSAEEAVERARKEMKKI